MQSLYPVEKAIRPGCPLSIGGQGQELRYVSDLYMPAHGVLADAIFPRYAAIRALPSRQQLLDSKALLVRANGTDPTQLLLLIHAAGARLLGNDCWLRCGLLLGLLRSALLSSASLRPGNRRTSGRRGDFPRLSWLPSLWAPSRPPRALAVQPRRAWWSGPYRSCGHFS